MDPLSILSVAAAVVQFVDFGTRLVSKAAAAYRGTSGEEERIVNLARISTDLDHLLQGIEEKMKLLDSIHSPLGSSEVLVLEQCKKSRAICQEVLHLVADISNAGIDKVDFSANAEPRGQTGIAGSSRWGRSAASSEKKPMESFRSAASKIPWRGKGISSGSGNSAGVMRVDDIAARLKETKNDLMLAMITGLWGKTITCQSEGDLRQQKLPLQHQIDTAPGLDNSRHAQIMTNLFNRDPTPENSTNVTGPLHTGRFDFQGRWVELGDGGCVGAILNSLDDPALHNREVGIADAHKQTFEWIFQTPRVLSESNTNQPSTTTPLWPDFSAWLSSDSDSIYWITGKPGSGKSTIMKFIAQHSQTDQLLSHWASGLPVLKASFYSWNAGTDFQKSLEGLLRTLLHQLVSGYPSLAPEVFPSRWAMMRLFGDDGDLPRALPPWTPDELLEAILSVRRFAGVKFRAAIFIDGLDEFTELDGSHDHLLTFISRIREEIPSLKLCVSSRPWTAFRDFFTLCPQLRMEVLTRADITTFVRSTMDGSPAFRELTQHAPADGESLVTTVIQKAEGVFLWVAVVTKALVAGLADGEMVTELQSLLEDIPSDLMQLYSQLWQRIRPYRRQHGATLILVFYTFMQSDQVRLVSDTLDLSMRKSLPREELEQQPGLPMYTKITTFMTPKILWLIDQGDPGQSEGYIQSTISRRLDSRTRGLLVIKQNGQIDYLHRTAKDWVERMLQRIKSEEAPQDFDPHLMILQWRAASISFPLNIDPKDTCPTAKIPDSNTDDIEVWRDEIFTEACRQVGQCMYHAVRVLDKAVNYQRIVDAVDDIERRVQAYIDDQGSDSPLCPPPFWNIALNTSNGLGSARRVAFMAMCARGGATTYIRAKISSSRSIFLALVVEMRESDGPGNKNELDCYVQIIANLALGFGQLMTLEELNIAKKMVGFRVRKRRLATMDNLLRLMSPTFFVPNLSRQYSARYQVLGELLELTLGAGVDEGQRQVQKALLKHLRTVCTELVVGENARFGNLTRRDAQEILMGENGHETDPGEIKNQVHYNDLVIRLFRRYGVTPSLRSRLEIMSRDLKVRAQYHLQR